MATELLVHAFDHDDILKGQIQTWREVVELDSHPWGTQEGPPNFCLIRVTDAAPTQVQALFDSWQDEFSVSFLGAGVGRDEFRVITDSRVTAVFGGDILPVVQEIIIGDLGGEIIDAALVTDIRVGVPFGRTDQRLLEEEVRRRYRNTHAPSRWQISPAQVDTALAQPDGRLELNTNSVFRDLVDRLNP